MRELVGVAAAAVAVAIEAEEDIVVAMTIAVAATMTAVTGARVNEALFSNPSYRRPRPCKTCDRVRAYRIQV